MNYLIILFILGRVLMIEGVLLFFPVIVSLFYKEPQGYIYLVLGVFCIVAGYLISNKKPLNHKFYAIEGFMTVALSWIIMSIFGAIPFILTKEIPNFIDAMFETVSGFTTTGASILTNIEALSKTSLFWRSFTHWIGGMGVFVFLLAILPMAGGYSMHLMRAESPGPSVGKLVPKVKDTAKLLYKIYFAMTLIQIILLLIAKMPLFDTLTLTFGTAGTGGFGIKNTSLQDYTIIQQLIITIFMILFGVNFNAYYLLLGNHKKEIFKMEEVRWYFLIIIVSIIIIAFNISSMFDSFLLALHHAAFQVGSIITTTGYTTENFDLWPQLSRTILVIIMFIGACAGSTGGGIKVSRIIIAFKSIKQEIKSYIKSRTVNTIRFDDRVLDNKIVKGVTIFLVTYIFIFAISMLILSLDNSIDLETNFTAVVATFNNIGPGLSKVGPSGTFGILSPLSKIVLIFDMLAGRLELFPLLILFTPSVWFNKKNS